MPDTAPAKRPGSCRDCPVACHAADRRHKKKYAAYAALWNLEAHSQGFEDFVAAYHHLCNDIGLEAFEVAGAIALGLAAGRVRPGLAGILAAMEEISQATELGRVLGGGVEAAGRAWNLTPPAQGPRKESGPQEREALFLDSVGLCAFAYEQAPRSPELWAALEAMLAAKYGSAFDLTNFRKIAGPPGRAERS